MRIGEKLPPKELGHNYELVLKNGRFVAGALTPRFVNLSLLVWVIQSPIIIIAGERLSNYEYDSLQVPAFEALVAGDLLLTRLTLRHTVRSLTIMDGWPIMIGLLVVTATTVVLLHVYLWTTVGLSIYAFGIGPTSAGLVRLTLPTSDISKSTVSTTTEMLQVLISTVGAEINEHT